MVLKSIGRAPTADLQIIALNPTDYGFDAQFTYGGDSYRYPIALMGRFQAENAILAALLARLSGLSLHDSFGALPALQPIAGRMQPVHGHPEKARILVDYAHTPDALSNVLGLVRDETKGTLAVLFGCGGDRDKGKRKLMGEAALALADVVYITDDNPRSEDPAAIRQDIIGDKATSFIEIGNRKDAIQAAIEGLGLVIVWLSLAKVMRQPKQSVMKHCHLMMALWRDLSCHFWGKEGHHDYELVP